MSHNIRMKTLKDLINEAHELIPRVTCKELSENLGEFFIVDVREGSEVMESGIIEGATNIPRGLLEFKMVPNSDTLPTHIPILVYCGGGSRAALAGKTLKGLGFTNVKNLEGGFRGWKESSSS